MLYHHHSDAAFRIAAVFCFYRETRPPGGKRRREVWSSPLRGVRLGSDADSGKWRYFAGHARVALDVASLRASNQAGRGHAVVCRQSYIRRRRPPVSRVSSWLNGRSSAINADDIDADQVVLVALMDDADGSRQSDRAVFPLTRRPCYWWGRDARPLASRPDSPLSPERRVASPLSDPATSYDEARQSATTSLPSSTRRLPVQRRMMNRKSMWLPVTSWRYLSLTFHVTGSRVTSKYDLFRSGDDVDTRRITRRALWFMQYSCARSHQSLCISARENISVWNTCHLSVGERSTGSRYVLTAVTV